MILLNRIKVSAFYIRFFYSTEFNSHDDILTYNIYYLDTVLFIIIMRIYKMKIFLFSYQL